MMNWASNVNWFQSQDSLEIRHSIAVSWGGPPHVYVNGLYSIKGEGEASIHIWEVHGWPLFAIILYLLHYAYKHNIWHVYKEAKEMVWVLTLKVKLLRACSLEFLISFSNSSLISTQECFVFDALYLELVLHIPSQLLMFTLPLAFTHWSHWIWTPSKGLSHFCLDSGTLCRPYPLLCLFWMGTRRNGMNVSYMFSSLPSY